jgi:hypothetical protein
MAVDHAVLEGKSSDELIAQIVEQDGKNTELADKNTKLEEKVAKFEEKPADNKPAEGTEKPAEGGEKPAEGTEKPAEGGEKPADNKAMTEVDKKFEERDKRLAEVEKENKDLKERNRKNDIELKLNEISESGMPPAVIEKMREIMLSDNGSTTYELSEKQEDGRAVAKNMTLSECVIALAEAIPLVQLGEETIVENKGSSDVSPDSKKDSDIEKVKQYAEENKMTFRDAMTKMLKEGKVKAPKYEVPEN